MEMYEIINNPEDGTLSELSEDLLNLLAPYVEEEPLQTIDRFVSDFFTSRMASLLIGIRNSHALCVLQALVSSQRKRNSKRFDTVTTSLNLSPHACACSLSCMLPHI